MLTKRRIGIDFDNTIIGYDEVFCATAKKCGLIDADFSGCKQAIRDAIRLLPNGEITWQRLQGQVYGKGIAGARVIEGVKSFLYRCQDEECSVVIVSHKTEYGHHDSERVNLREAALGWMAEQGLFREGCEAPIERVFFESTRADKLKRIESLSLSHFIDDLEEVLTDPAFPAKVKRVLFAQQRSTVATSYVVCQTWREIEDYVFERR